MPMFDYRCRKCGHVFEELVFSSRVKDEEITCPNCNTKDAERLMSAPSIGSSGGSASSISGGNCSPSSGFT